MGNNLLETNIPVPSWGLDEIVVDANATAQAISDPDSIDPTFIFGSFIPTAQALINIITFQYFLAVLHILPFPTDFVLIMQALLGIASLFAIIYMISGRGTQQGN